MKIIKFLKIISIISYLLIILMGQMVGIPFIFWLLFTLFDFGTIDQLFAIIGVSGVLLNLTKWKNAVPITILSFFMMLFPIIYRIVQVPIELFDYTAFKLPLSVFLIGYIIFIILNARKGKVHFHNTSELQ